MSLPSDCCSVALCITPSMSTPYLLGIGQRSRICQTCIKLLCEHQTRGLPLPDFLKNVSMIGCEPPCLGIAWNIPNQRPSLTRNPSNPACLNCHPEEFCYKCIIQNQLTFLNGPLAGVCEHKGVSVTFIQDSEVDAYTTSLLTLCNKEKSSRCDTFPSLFGFGSIEKHARKEFPWQTRPRLSLTIVPRPQPRSDESDWIIPDDTYESYSPDDPISVNNPPIRLPFPRRPQSRGLLPLLNTRGQTMGPDLIQLLSAMNEAFGPDETRPALDPIKPSNFSATSHFVSNPFMSMEGKCRRKRCGTHNEPLIRSSHLKSCGLAGSEKLCVACITGSSTRSSSIVPRFLHCPCGECGLVVDTKAVPILLSNQSVFSKIVASERDLGESKNAKVWYENVGCLPHMARKGLICPYALSRNVIKIRSKAEQKTEEKTSMKTDEKDKKKKRKRESTESKDEEKNLLVVKHDNAALMSEIQCCACQEIPYTGQILSCSGNGHIMCFTCLEGMKAATPEKRNVCPMCRAKSGFTRALLAEKIRSVVTISCPNKTSGCAFISQGSEMGKHISSECVYRQSPCVLCEGSASGGTTAHGISVRSPEWPSACRCMPATVEFGLSVKLDPLYRTHNATATVTDHPFLLPSFKHDWVLRWTCKLRDDDSTTFIAIVNAKSTLGIRVFSQKPEALWMRFTHNSTQKSTKVRVLSAAKGSNFPHATLEHILALPCIHKDSVCDTTKCPSHPVLETHGYDSAWTVSILLEDEL